MSEFYCDDFNETYQVPPWHAPSFLYSERWDSTWYGNKWEKVGSYAAAELESHALEAFWNLFDELLI